METLKIFLQSIVSEHRMIQGVLSNVKKGVTKTYEKVVVVPVVLKGERLYHVAYHYQTKVMHENLSAEEMVDCFNRHLGAYFKQGVFYLNESDVQILFNKKGEWKKLTQTATKSQKPLEHNRKKQYLIPEGTPCDFMIRLGIMDESGQVIPKKYDKFRQLNKYLEFVRDSLSELDENQPIRIVDFGCGKAYLTFALYYYLVKEKRLKVEIVGLDLKEDVIAFCGAVAKELHYEGLTFEKGDIKGYETIKPIDMVVSLHACDTATDAALEKAVAWGAKVIFAVPCCQHELFKQLKNQAMAPLIAHGILRDKLTALVTDGLRALALETRGYEVQVIEFIDLAHTPKNVLIRGYLKPFDSEKVQASVNRYETLKGAWGVRPAIDRVVYQLSE